MPDSCRRTVAALGAGLLFAALLTMLWSAGSVAAAGAGGHVYVMLLNSGGGDRSLGIRPAAETFAETDWGQALGSAPTPFQTLFPLLTGIPGLASAMSAREASLWQLYQQPASAEQKRYRQRLLENYWSVRYVLADPDSGYQMVSTAPGAYQLLAQLGDPLMLVGIEKRFYLPRVYFRTSVLPIRSFGDFLSLFDQPGKLRPFQSVAIENPRHRPEGPELLQGAVMPKLQAIGDHRLQIGIQAPQAGYLVLADPMRASLRAVVDGRQVPLEIANGYQAAIWLEPGEHQIIFTGLAPQIPWTPAAVQP